MGFCTHADLRMLASLLPLLIFVVEGITMCNAYCPSRGLLSLSWSRSAATTTTTTTTSAATKRGTQAVLLRMAGGRGWSNDDFLSSLSGDDGEREKAQDDYQEFSDRRAAFLERQGEILKSPQGQAFVRQQQQRQQEQQQRVGTTNADDEGVDETGAAGFSLDSPVEPGSGGGTRMRHMMAQAKRMQDARQRNPMTNSGGLGAVDGFQQKFIVPLDYEEEDEGEE